jgi:hypothetical protein
VRDNVRRLPRRIPNPWHWAWVLWVYQRWERLDDLALADELGMPAANLSTLRSLPCADLDPRGYAAGLARAGAAVGCSPFVLARIFARVNDA